MGQQNPAESCQAACRVCNDLSIAVEIDLGLDGWKVLYPESTLEVPADQMLRARLRDCPEVLGDAMGSVGGTLWVPGHFGAKFAADSKQIIEQEEKAAAREAELLHARKKEISVALKARVGKSIASRRTCSLILVLVIVTASLTGMVVCSVLAYNLDQEGLALVLSVMILLLWCCLYGCLPLLPAPTDDVSSVQSTSELPAQRGLDEGIMLVFFCFWPFGISCAAVMTGAFASQNFMWATLVLWLAVAICFGPWLLFWGFVLCSACPWKRKGQDRLKYLAEAVIDPCTMWPRALFKRFAPGTFDRFFAMQFLPKTWPTAASTHPHTIFFEGHVLPGRRTITSWPGKYESAWDALVASAHRDEISAAVVFLPEESPNLGLHDRIPMQFRDLRGPCWCTPLYGESKPWGCRWWTRWIQNVERTMKPGATLEVSARRAKERPRASRLLAASTGAKKKLRRK